MVSMAESYDKRDNLVRVNHRHSNFSDFTGTTAMALDVFHDLEEKRYFTQYTPHESFLNVDLSVKKDFNPKKMGKLYIFRD